MNAVFHSFPLVHGSLADLQGDDLPSALNAWNRQKLPLAERGTHFGIVAEGASILTCESGVFELKAGMYFSVPGRGAVEGGAGAVFTRWDYRGFFQIGGPIESEGRLRYINGCTDSVLIPPVVAGDPCLNLLCIPPGVDQTPHTHPSPRLGVVVAGRGACHTPGGTVALSPGRAWYIRPNGLHSFHTQASGLSIVAYHPDSDSGPSDADHPMLNRTTIDGQSARCEPTLGVAKVSPPPLPYPSRREGTYGRGVP